MSARIVLNCDTVRGFSACAQSLMTDGLSVSEARTIGAAYGWRHTTGKDYCPACSGVRARPRVILAYADAALRAPALRPEEVLQDAESMLTAAVNRATGGRWVYRPPVTGSWPAVDGPAPAGLEHVTGGPRGTESVARTGPAGQAQAAADAAYIATVDPDVGRAAAAVLHEAFESVHDDGGIVQDSLRQAAVDLAAALTQPRTPQESP